MTAQIADSVGVKTMTICTGSALPVENAGYDSVRIMSSTDVARARSYPRLSSRWLAAAAANRASFR